MTCILTVIFQTPGYGTGTETVLYSVPDGSYTSPRIVPRPDLGYNGSDNNSYSLDCDGSQGILRLGTYQPGSIKVSVQSADNSCSAEPPPPTTAYDCVNGACVAAAVYKTPGIYKTLSECEVSCGPGCSGVCVAKADWARIEGLASQLKNKNCS